jgi:hypothetical protein
MIGILLLEPLPWLDLSADAWFVGEDPVEVVDLEPLVMDDRPVVLVGSELLRGSEVDAVELPVAERPKSDDELGDEDVCEVWKRNELLDAPGV